jgi:dipeptidase E
MKLLFSSKGLNTEGIKKTFLTLLNKPPELVKVQIMGVNPGLQGFDMNSYADEDRQELIKIGISPENIRFNEIDIEPPATLDDVDVILMLGGSEYRHMYHIKKQGLEQPIRDFVNRGGVYVGRSAGAVIMGPTVDIGYWAVFTDDVGLEDTSGFGFVDFITVPHIDTRKEPEKVLEFHKNTGHKMVYLTDEQGILVTNDTYKII